MLVSYVCLSWVRRFWLDVFGLRVPLRTISQGAGDSNLWVLEVALVAGAIGWVFSFSVSHNLALEALYTQINFVESCWKRFCFVFSSTRYHPQSNTACKKHLQSSFAVRHTDTEATTQFSLRVWLFVTCISGVFLCVLCI